MDSVVKECPRCQSVYNPLTWALLTILEKLPVDGDESHTSTFEVRKCYCGLALTALKEDTK